MDTQQRAKRLGALLIVTALSLRLLGAQLWTPLLDTLRSPRVQSFLIYLETGRKVRFSPSLEGKAELVGESPPPQVLQGAELPRFSAEDASVLKMTYSCALRPDLEQALTEHLSWNLTGGEPAVLILHTHATESYTKTGETYSETAAFRTLDEGYNMLSIGDRVAEILSRGGVSVIHDRELHDYPSYNGSYDHARESIEYYLARYPSIGLVLDLHRDASGDLRNQIRPLAQVEGQNCAQLMLVMGTNAAGLRHPNWQENLSLAAKLQVQLERQAPGITRPINLRAQRFNQDLSPGALLVEVGAAGNTHSEALLAAEQLARAVLALARGTARES